MTSSDTATIYDVAQLARVSPSTVSHVLNKTRHVSSETRQRVEDAIQVLEFRPNNAARLLREGKTRLIGLILPDISNTFFGDLARRIEMLAYDQEARVLTCNSDYDREREIAYIEDLARRRVDGIIIAPVSPDPQTQAMLRATGLPVVLIDRVAGENQLPNVAVDNESGAALAAEHLVRLGHRHIGCITVSPGQVESIDARTRGFTHHLRQLGIALPERAIAYSDFRTLGGMEAAAQLIAAYPEVTAVFCANDLMAIGAIRAAHAAGLSVPGELSIVGFDDSLEAQVSHPPLTTIAQPAAQMAARAMDMLRAPAGKADDAAVKLGARLTLRRSTAPPPDAQAPPATASDTSSVSPFRSRAMGKRVIVIGAGRIGQVHARAVSQTPGAVLAGIHDPDTGRAATLAQAYDSKVVEDLEHALAAGEAEAVVIGAPSDRHLPLLTLAARYGAHVFCEKPLALTEADIRQAIALCQAANVALQVGFNRRFDPNAVAIADGVRSGKLGKPYTIRITSRDPAPPPRAFIRSSGGIFQDFTIHDFDLCRFILRDEVTEVTAVGGCVIDPMFAEEGDIDVVTLTLRFASGAIGVIENTRATPYGYDQRIEVLGSEGAFESENQAAHRVVYRSPSGQSAPLPLPFFLERYEVAFGRQMASFIAALNSDDPARAIVVSGEDALAVHRLCEAAALSVREGRPVKLAGI